MRAPKPASARRSDPPPLSRVAFPQKSGTAERTSPSKSPVPPFIDRLGSSYGAGVLVVAGLDRPVGRGAIPDHMERHRCRLARRERPRLVEELRTPEVRFGQELWLARQGQVDGRSTVPLDHEPL